MLVILSDIHLTDGSASTNVHPKAFKILGDEIQGNAKSNKVQDIHLLLLGDIFDLVRTDWWFDNANVTQANRPWNGIIDPATGMNANIKDVDRQFNAVFDRILLQPGPLAFLQMIREVFTFQKNLTITYVIGNHDRVVNNLPSLQIRIAAQFPVKVTFTDALNAPEYGVSARHGHEWDDNCNARLLQKILQPAAKWKRLDPAINKVMAIGEVITAELMSGLVSQVRKSGDKTITDIIEQADTLRPAISVFDWLDWEAGAHSLTSAQKKCIADSLIKAISGVVDSSLGKEWTKIQWNTVLSGDIIDRLKRAKFLLEKFSFGGMRACVDLFSIFVNDDENADHDKDAYYNGAKEELGAQPHNIQYIVYGHTHRARHDYFSGYGEDRVNMYINTGTYLQLLERTDDESSFARSYQMTMAFFYKDGEDENAVGGGPSIDLWNGIKRKRYV